MERLVIENQLEVNVEEITDSLLGIKKRKETKD
jgi:hypothetical protein